VIVVYASNMRRLWIITAFNTGNCFQ